MKNLTQTLKKCAVKSVISPNKLQQRLKNSTKRTPRKWKNNPNTIIHTFTHTVEVGKISETRTALAPKSKVQAWL